MKSLLCDQDEYADCSSKKINREKESQQSVVGKVVIDV